MDTSKEYIDMCSKAIELLSLMPRESTWDIKSFWAPGIPNIWLPRQDQLQEIINDPFSSVGPIYDLLNKLYNFRVNDEMQGRVKSWEMFLLLYIMKTKYNKTWNGKEWIRITYG